MLYLDFSKLLKFNLYGYYFRQIWWKYITPRRVKSLGVSVSDNVIFYGSPIISLFAGSKIEIGEGSVVCSVSEMTALGVNHSVVMRTLTENAHIKIGKNTGISGASICSARLVEIGDECLLGANVVIVDTDFHSVNSFQRRFNSDLIEIGTKPTIIENNVFIGTGAYILKGVRIGRNSVIGAGSVITKDVPPDCVVGGNPATILKYL
jgi:acetyltransferase-like isoleucine patch superfamily enzyme